jgi:hypothetical protein
MQRNYNIQWQAGNGQNVPETTKYKKHFFSYLASQKSYGTFA